MSSTQWNLAFIVHICDADATLTFITQLLNSNCYWDCATRCHWSKSVLLNLRFDI